MFKPPARENKRVASGKAWIILRDDSPEPKDVSLLPCGLAGGFLIFSVIESPTLQIKPI